MIRSTNLAPGTRTGLPAEPDSHVLGVAALATTTTGVAAAYLRLDPRHPPMLDRFTVAVAYEYLGRPPDWPGGRFTGVVDRRLAEWSRAEVIAGHDMPTTLHRIAEIAQDPSTPAASTALRRAWSHRGHRRGVGSHPAVLLDTAVDLEHSELDLGATARAYRLHSDLLSAEPSTELAAITRAAAIALLAAHRRRLCRWATLDLDPIIAAELDQQPPHTVISR